MKKNLRDVLFFLNLLLLVPVVSVFGQVPTIIAQSGFPVGSNDAGKGVAYGNSVYVSITGKGRVYTSTDGISWQFAADLGPDLSLLGSNLSLTGVDFGNSKFVIVGDNGFISTSSDGVTWTTRTPGTSNRLAEVKFIQSQFFAVGQNKTLLTSSDGISWSAVTVNGGSLTYNFRSITYGNGEYLISSHAGGGGGGIHLFRSSTAASNSWTYQDLGLALGTANSINTAQYLKDRFFIFTSGSTVYTSTDAANWTDVTSSTVNHPNGSTSTLATPNQTFRGIYDGNNIYLFGSSQYYSGYGAVYKSADGVSYTLLPKSAYIVGQGAAYLNGKYFQWGTEGMVYSNDGAEYHYPGGSYSSVASNGVNYVAVGSVGNAGVIFTSSDFSTFTEMTPSDQKPLTSVVYNGSKYLAVGDRTVLESANGTSWTSAVSSTDYFTSLAYGSSKYVAVGYDAGTFAAKIAYSSTGASWTTANTDDNYYLKVKYVNGRFFALGYANTTSEGVIQTSTDGVTWSDITPDYGIPNYKVYYYNDVVWDGAKYHFMGMEYLDYANGTISFFTISTSDPISATSFSGKAVITNQPGGVTLGGAFGESAFEYVSGQFLGVVSDIASSQAYVIYSSTGSSWTSVPTDLYASFYGGLPESDRVRFAGSGDSKLTVQIASSNTAPTATAVNNTGTLTVGQALTGSYTYSDAESDVENGSTYKWYRSDDAAGTGKTAISSAAATTYTLVAADIGKYISFEVTPKDGTSFGTPVESSRRGPVTAPAITSVTYDASTGILAVTGTDFQANGSGADADVSKLTLTGEGGSTYTLTTSGVEITSATAFSVTLNATDKSAVNQMLNKNGTSSTGGTTYNLAAAADWMTVVSGAADLTGNGITVSNVAVPAITSGTYNASTGALLVTGTGFLSASGATNDIVANKFTFTGEGGATYTLTDSANPEITSGTAFTISLSATDKSAVNQMVNKNGTSSTGGTTYNLAAAEAWAAGANAAVAVADVTGNGITVSNVAVPAITSATYDASTGALTVTGTGFLSLSGATNDIVANKITFTGEGGTTYTLTNSTNVEITSGTSFTISLSATDKAAVNQMVNKNGTSSTGGTTYNLAAAEDWAAGANAAVAVADVTGNGITVSNVAVPAITSATYDASTGALTVTGTGFLSLSGATNDIVANKFTFTGEGGSTYTLTDSANPEITSGTAFTISLSATDKASVNQIVNKNGTSSTGGTTYNLAAAEDWAAGANAAVAVADVTGNGVTVSNVAVPAITSATYDAFTGSLTVTGTGFLSLSGGTNDIVANKFTFTGEGGSTYTLTNSTNVEITSGTAFTITLSATDRAAVNQMVNKNGTSSTGGTTYNLAAAEDWAAGADAAVAVADVTGNGITVSNVAVPAITSATYDASTGALTVTGTGFLSANGATNDIVANKFTFTGEGGSTSTLTNSTNVEITSQTSFTISLSVTDKAAVNQIVNKNGTSSTGGTTYNLSAAEDWAAGADAAVVVADGTANGITVSNVAVPAITSATYDASTGALTVTGTGLLSASGATNDIIANKFTFTGEGGSTYTLTNSTNVEITSGTSFTINLSATDKAGVNPILNKNGATSTDATNYNLAASEDWAAGADAGVVVADGTGNGITVSNADNTPPTVSSVNSSTANATYRAGHSISIQVNFSEAVSVTGTPQLTLETGTTDQVINYASGSGTSTLSFSYTIQAGDISADLDYTATGALALNGGTIRDVASNNATLTLPAPGGANSLANNKSIVVDGVAPSVSSINRVTSAATNASSVDFLVTFSENVTGVDVTDFSVTATGTAAASIAAVTAVNSSSYTISLNTVSGDGTIRLDLNSTGTGINDTPGNAISSGYTAGQTYTIDHTAPTVSSVSVPANDTYVANENLNFTVNFGENVTVNTGGGTPRIALTLNTGGTVYASYLSGSGTSALTFRYTVSAGAADNNGITVGALDDNGGTLKDAAGNDATLTLNSVGSTAAVLVDAAVPTATIVIADAALSAGETSLVTITFSEAVSGFTNADLTIVNGTLSAVSSSDGGITWTATFTPTASITDASNVITLDNTGVTDAVGNAGSGITESNNYAIDTARPTATIVVADAAFSAGETSLVTITFSEAVTGFTNADLAAANGSLSAVSSGDGGITWTATFTPTAGITDGTNVITLANTGVTDAAGNAGSGTTNSNNYAIDSQAPTLSSVAVISNNSNTALAKTGDIVTISLTASEAIATPAVTISGETATVSGTGTSYTATYTMSAGDTEGLVTFSITYTDLAGNDGTAVSATTNSSAVTFDRTAPATPSSLAAVSGNTEVVLNWSENAETDLKNYNVYGGTTANPTVLLQTISSGTTTYTHTGLTNGTAYYYRISATDNAGNESVVSTDVTATPAAAQTITFNTLAAQTYGNADFDAGATASSGLTVSYSSDNTAVATIVAGKIHITGAGTATITASQAGSAAFTPASPQVQTLTVNKKDITVTLSPTPVITKVYDGTTQATLAAGNYILNSLETGDEVTISGSASYSDQNGEAVKTVTATNFILAGAQKDNYHLTTTTATTTGVITAKTLTVTAADQTKFQGTANPALTVAYSGFITGEDESDLTVQPTATTTATVSSALGAYPITISGGVSANYSFDYVPGTLNVVPGAPTSISLAGVTLYENQSAATAAGTLSSTSDDPNAVFTYTLVSGSGDSNNDLFRIDGNQISTTSHLNYEQKSSYSIRVRSTTQHGFSLDEAFIVHISDVNEVPTFAAIGNQTICYTTAPQRITLADVSAGPEASQAVTLAVSTDNADLFEQLAISNDGRLTYQVKSGQSGTANITVTIQDNGGTDHGGEDTFSRSFSITVNPLPVITINSDKGTSISKGETVRLTARGGASYSWSSAAGVIGGQSSATLTIRPEATATYRVQVTTAAGCIEEQEIRIEVKEDYAALDQTNIVTPNGDGRNDNFIIKNIDMYPNNEVKIYDRAGRLLYSKKNYTSEWDGTFQGSPLEEGTYYYIVDFGNSKPVLKGFITIVRD